MLKKLKSLFVVDDPAEVEASKSHSAKSSKSTSNTAQASKNSSTNTKVEDVLSEVRYDPTTKPNPKFVNVLLGAIDKSNQQGFDYLEYKSALQSLKDVDMDEATRYKSAFAMAKTMGTSVQKLINSAEFYIQVLQKEYGKFNQAHKSQRQKLVSGKKTQIENLKKGIEAKKKQIETLKTQIKKDEALLSKLNSGIDAAASKIENTGLAFKHAYDTVLSQIVADAENIQKYLK